MSDKKEQLLNESTIRRFMGLAGIGALTEKFVDNNELNEKTMQVEVPDLSDDAEFTNQTPLPEQLEDELPPEPGEMAVPGPEAEVPLDDEDLGEEEAVEDVDLSQEEAEVLINLGKKLEAEMGEEELPPEEGLPPEGELPPEAAELAGLPPGLAGPPEEELGLPPGAMAESLVRELTTRVSNRIKKEYIVNEVMKRVATRLKTTPKKK